MPKLETIYLVHHSHTDIGYTHDQPIVWELHTRFIDDAIHLAEKYADSDTDGAFKWTVETTKVLSRWLARSKDKDIERFQAMEKAGRIEVTGMFANLTPLLDTDQLIESFQLINRLRKDYGFTINHAMNCDVNGENWSLVDLLLDLGIEGFTMAINSHFGGALQPRPHTFMWQGPSGRSIAANNGWPYDKGWREGIGRDADDLKNVRLPRLQAYLDKIGYPLPILLLQSYHPYGDNGSAFDFTPFIDDWNAAGNSPRIILATPSIWWNAVKEHQDSLETLRGDWTDYWNFGSISSAREQTMNRISRERLRSADALYGSVKSLQQDAGWADLSFGQYRTQAWEDLILWDEHTWGADISIVAPDSDDTATQWNHKAHYAYSARSLSLMLQRDAIAELAKNIQSGNKDDILVFNPLPWAQTYSGRIPYFTTAPRGVIEDGTASRHHQDRDVSRASAWTQEKVLFLPPTEVPGLGYTVIAKQDAPAVEEPIIYEDGIVENQRYRITFNRDNGGISSLYDKTLDWELVDTDGDYPFNSYVYEKVADENTEWPRFKLFRQHWNIDQAEIPPGWQPGWHAKRYSADEVISHHVYETPAGMVVEQILEAPGCEGNITQRVFLPNYDDYVEFESSWSMGLNPHPDATYILYPFNLNDAKVRYDIGGQSVIAGDEQLPGVCRDYFTVQKWVAFSNEDRGVIIATPDNPMVQVGGFHFAEYQMDFDLERAMLLGWVTNNYWETNFRAHQPGAVTSRYRVLPYKGKFDEAVAHKFGVSAANSRAVYQHMGEPKSENASLPQTGSLLELPQGAVLTLHVKKANDGDGLIVRLLNASDSEQSATVGSAILKITEASLCDLLENPVNTLKVGDGKVTFSIAPRMVATLRLTINN